jgi:cellulose synthase/poly-beta-1,6-N-acetylglucosamine synthase-like glycosyltransferase
MRRSISEYWSNRRILWQQYSSSHNSQYRRRFYRLLTDSRDQSFDSAEIDLNRCKHECRSRYSAFNNWLACMRFFSSTNVSANETFKVISLDVCVDSSSKFSIFWSFFSHLAFSLAFLTAARSLEFDSRILMIFFLISSFDFHSIERIFSIK